MVVKKDIGGVMKLTDCYEDTGSLLQRKLTEFFSAAFVIPHYILVLLFNDALTIQKTYTTQQNITKAGHICSKTKKLFAFNMP